VNRFADRFESSRRTIGGIELRKLGGMMAPNGRQENSSAHLMTGLAPKEAKVQFISNWNRARAAEE
jgi:hypothetical protein